MVNKSNYKPSDSHGLSEIAKIKIKNIFDYTQFNRTVISFQKNNNILNKTKFNSIDFLNILFSTLAMNDCYIFQENIFYELVSVLEHCPFLSSMITIKNDAFLREYVDIKHSLNDKIENGELQFMQNENEINYTITSNYDDLYIIYLAYSSHPELIREIENLQYGLFSIDEYIYHDNIDIIDVTDRNR